MNTYTVPDLPYEYSALEPIISEQTLKLHHDIHHKGYVDNANGILEKLHAEGADQKALLKGLSFNVGGHILHTLFWENLSPEGGEPEGELKNLLESEFGSIEQFKKEFTAAANSTEGSGWAALTYDPNTKRPIIMQIEKHNVNVYPGFKILLVIDVWEHAYYLDYQNKRGEFTEEFWKIVNWKVIAERL